MSCSNILISNLLPPQSNSSPISFSIKLTNDLIHLLKSNGSNNKIKLIVKNGNVSIKLSEELVLPCLPLPENLPVDIYSISNKSTSTKLVSQYDGRIINKLTVVTDSKKIKEINAANALSSNHNNKLGSYINGNTNSNSNNNNTNNRLTPSLLVPSSPVSRRSAYSTYSNTTKNPYKISLSSDNQASIIKKFIHLLALGPITYNHIVDLLDYTKIDHLLDDYGQVYNDQDQFIQEDRFPYIDSNNNSNDDSDDDMDEEVQRFILKDKSYKELTPWKWNYTNYERNSILNNVNNALTRIGFSQSHPLRRKIVEPPNEDDNRSETKKPNGSSLGGGFLISSSSSVSSNNKKRSTPTPVPSKANTPVNTTSKVNTPVNTTSKINTPVVSSSKVNTPVVAPPKATTPVVASSKASTPVNIPPRNTNSNSIPSPPVKVKVNNKRKFSSSSSSSEDDDSKKLNYTSPPSSEEESTSNNNNASGHNGVNSQKSKLDYYTNLAIKFKNKYKEYSELYNALLNKNEIKAIDYKDNLMKLFKLHQNLTQWKKLLWDFDKESKLKNSLSDIHIERNTTPITSSSGSSSTSIFKASSPSSTVLDAHPPGIKTATPFKRRKVMDY